MQISARGDYAVRAAVALAVSYPRTISTQVLSAEQRMPRKFLETILADLRQSRAQLLEISTGEPVIGQLIGYLRGRQAMRGRIAARRAG